MLAEFILAAAATIAPPPDDMAGLYGNTVISKDGGIESHFYYAADHTFTGTVPAFYFALKGSWRENADGTVCRVFDPPLPRVKNPDCGPLAVHQVGDRKIFDDGDSQALVPGIQ
jgi:hypothetical protein